MLLKSNILPCTKLPFFIVMFFIPLSAKAINIEQIPQLIEEQNRDVQSVKENTKAAEEEINVARGRYFPKIELNATYTKMNKELIMEPKPINLEVDLTPITKTPYTLQKTFTPDPIHLQNQSFTKVTLQAVQPLFTGGKLSNAYEIAKSRHSEAQVEVQNVTQNQTNAALNRYFQVQLAIECVRILTDIKKNLDNIVTISNKLVENGVVAKFYILQINTARAELVAKIEEAKAKENLAKNALKTILTMEYNKSITLETPLKKLPLEKNIEFYQENAIKNRGELKVIDAKREQLNYLHKIQGGEMLPTIYIFGKDELVTKYLTAFDPTWAVGLGITFPLSAPFTQYFEQQKSEIMISKVLNIKNKALNEIPLQVEQYYSEAKTLDGALVAVEEANKQALESLRVATVRFQAGEGNSMELLSSANDLEKIKIRKAELLEQYNRNLLNLYWAAGNVNDYIELYKKN